MTTIDYSNIVNMMQKGGAYRFYMAKTQATDTNRMQTLWSQIQLQRIHSQDNAKDCCFLLKYQEEYAVTMDEITLLADLIQLDYPGDIIWDYENIHGDTVILEFIG